MITRSALAFLAFAAAAAAALPVAAAEGNPPLITAANRAVPMQFDIRFGGKDYKDNGSARIATMSGRSVSTGATTKTSYLGSASRVVDSDGERVSLKPASLTTGMTLTVTPVLLDATHVRLRVETLWSELSSMNAVTLSPEEPAAAKAKPSLEEIRAAIEAMPESYEDFAKASEEAKAVESAPLTIQMPNVDSKKSLSEVVAKVGQPTRVKLGLGDGKGANRPEWVEITAHVKL